MAYSTVAVDTEYLKKIDELSTLFSMSKVSFIHAMVDYFEYHKINPLERKESLDTKLSKIEHNLESKLNKVRDTFVSFQRELEKKKLEPLITQSNASTQALLVFLKEQALTKDDLKNIGLGTARKVAVLDNPEVPEKNRMLFCPVILYLPMKCCSLRRRHERTLSYIRAILPNY